MVCECSSQVQAYHDGELSPQAGAALEAHLAECSACRQALADLRAISALIREMTPAEPREEAIARWSSAAAVVEDRGVRRLAEWMTAAAAALLVFAMIPASERPAMDAPDAAGMLDAVVVTMPADDETVSPTLVTAQWLATDLAMGEKGGV